MISEILLLLGLTKKRTTWYLELFSIWPLGTFVWLHYLGFLVYGHLLWIFILFWGSVVVMIKVLCISFFFFRMPLFFLKGSLVWFAKNMVLSSFCLLGPKIEISADMSIYPSIYLFLEVPIYLIRRTFNVS